MPFSPVLIIVLPCYNEREILPISAKTLNEEMHRLVSEKLISEKSKMLFVDDGSSDGTFDVIRQFSKTYNFTAGLSYSPNKGMFNAIYAGIKQALAFGADVVITIDSDLQDDINAIRAMLLKFQNAKCDVVFGVRSDRGSDKFLKRFTAENYYKFMNKIGVPLLFNHAEYRLMSRKICENLVEFNEDMLYFRASVQMLSAKSAVVEYSRKIRLAGETKFRPIKMLGLALSSILTYSKLPFQFFTLITAIFGVIGVTGCIVFLVQNKFNDAFFAILLSILLFGVSFAISFIGRIYRSKFKPVYRIKDVLNMDMESL